MDANLATLLGLLVTSVTASITAIVVAFINMKKIDKGNATTDVVHTIVNGEKARIIAERDAAQAEVKRLTALLP